MRNLSTTASKSFSILLLVLTVSITNAATNYVSKTGGNIPPYDSWANAATTIQAAVSASGADDIILISDGTYFPTNQIELSENRILVSLNGTEKTVVDGSKSNRCFQLSDNAFLAGLTISNCYKNLYGGAIILESGNTISNCVFTHNSAGGWGGAVYSEGTVLNCSFINNSVSGDRGGAVAVFENGIIRNCSFSYNSCTNMGGAVFCYQGGLVENCSFVRNSANSSKGGAVYCYKGGLVENCSFDLNYSGSKGGAAYFYNSGEFIDCTFNTNYSYGNGGAVYLSEGGTLTNCIIRGSSAIGGYGGAVYCNGNGKLLHCTIDNNYSDELAGGIWAYGGTFDNCTIINNNSAKHCGGINCKNNSVIQDCLIAGNWAVESAGGVYFETPCTFRRCIISSNIANSAAGIRLSVNTLVENCLINYNRADANGGGAYCSSGGTLQNCTIVNNQAAHGAGVYSYDGTVVNCILWNNNNDQNSFHSGSEIFYNCIENWTNVVDGIITNNPLFFSETDFHIMEGSPCLNSGTNLPGISNQKDLDGNQRVDEGLVDMGCYEGVPEPFGIWIIGLLELWIIGRRRFLLGVKSRNIFRPVGTRA